MACVLCNGGSMKTEEAGRAAGRVGGFVGYGFVVDELSEARPWGGVG